MIRYWLTIMQGSNRGREYDLEDNMIVVGRHPDTGININDTEVSRKHFVLIKKADEYWIEDLDSTNGTVVNGRPIKSEYRLRDNSKINLGANVSLVFNKDVPLPTVEKTQPSKIEQEPEEEEDKIQPEEKAEEKAEEKIAVEKTPDPARLKRKGPRPESEKRRPPAKKKKKPATKEKKQGSNWFAWGCFGFLLILVLAAVAALYYIDANFLWCELFSDWLPGCY